MKKSCVFVLMGLLAVAMIGFFVSPASGQAQGTTLTATVTCDPMYTRTFGWTIDKAVTPDNWDLFRGDAGTSQYTITVTKDGGTDAAWIEGEICVTNGGASATEDLMIAIDLKDGLPPPNDWIATYNLDISEKPVLESGETYCYSYHAVIPGGSVHPSGTYKITPNITIMNHSGYIGTPFGPSPSCSNALPSGPTLINDMIHVDDSNGGTYVFNAGGSETYTKTFMCDNDEGTHSNTATIRETGQSDDALVTVTCYALDIQKDASTSYTRTYNWTIDKWANLSDLTLSPGQIYTGVSYSIVVDATYTDSDWVVAGTITVSNPAPMSATINSITDVVSDVGSAAVDCGVDFPYDLPAGETMTCTYGVGLPDAATRTNTATATLQNYTYDYMANATADGTTDFSASATVDFGAAAVTYIDECIDVTDVYTGAMGTVCFAEVPRTFTYTRDIGPYNVCGEYTVDNYASFETNDLYFVGSDEWSVAVSVPCAGGCTLTFGYWKTHSEFGPAPYDDTWALLPNGASTPFYLSGSTWYGVLWENNAPGAPGASALKPSPGVDNTYYILARQYVAAKLNILNGAASTPEVDAAIAWAETQFFNLYMPMTALTNPVKLQAKLYATMLDNYNNGLIGPGHCSENGYTEFKPDVMVNNTPAALPDAFRLDQNYPNPFNPTTTISYSVPYESSVRIEVFNILGQNVRTLVDELKPAGAYRIVWDGTDQSGQPVASGMYFYRLQAGDYLQTKKMLLMK